jgi:hypothetical protein
VLIGTLLKGLAWRALVHRTGDRHRVPKTHILGLAGGLAGRGIALPQIQRPPVVGLLQGAAAPHRAQQRRPDPRTWAWPGHRARQQQRRPPSGAQPGAPRRPAVLGNVHVQGKAPAVVMTLPRPAIARARTSYRGPPLPGPPPQPAAAAAPARTATARHNTRQHAPVARPPPARPSPSPRPGLPARAMPHPVVDQQLRRYRQARQGKPYRACRPSTLQGQGGLLATRKHTTAQATAGAIADPPAAVLLAAHVRAGDSGEHRHPARQGAADLYPTRPDAVPATSKTSPPSGRRRQISMGWQRCSPVILHAEHSPGLCQHRHSGVVSRVSRFGWYLCVQAGSVAGLGRCWGRVRCHVAQPRPRP